MSKIGKKSVHLPSGVKLSVENSIVRVQGPKGVLELDTRGLVKIEHDENEVRVLPKSENDTSYQGLYRTLINNLVIGVTDGFTKKLELVGIGFKASLQDGNLVLNVGYSHPVVIKKVQGVEYSVSDNVISVRGIDKVLVGDVAAKIRAVRPPEPYKGKGIRYQGEYIIRKQSKGSRA